jgi:hypothetical protein
LAAPLEVVVAAKLQHVRSKIVSLNDKVLDDSIEGWVRVFDTRDWNITNVLEDSRENDVGNICEKMLLEGRLTTLVISKIEEELLETVAELLAEGVSSELVAEELDLIDKTVGVGSISLTEKEVSSVIESVTLIVGGVLENVSLLLEALANISVKVLEPLAELGIVIRILVDLIKSIEKIVRRSAVGKSLNQKLEVILSGLEVIIIMNTLDILLSVVSQLLAVAGIGLSQAEKSLNGLSVILMALDLDNHLLQSPDGLFATFLWNLLEWALALVIYTELIIG